MSSLSVKYKRLGKNTFFIFLGNIGPRLISFVLMPFYTFWLSELDFGIQDILLVYSVLLIPYVTLGMHEAVFVFPKGKDRSEQNSYFTTSIIVVLIMQLFWGLLFLLTPQSIMKILLPDKLIDYEWLLFLIIVIESYQRLFQSFTRGIDKMKVFSITGIVYAIVMLVLSLWLVPIYELNGYWIALVSADMLSVIYTFIAIKGWTYIRIYKKSIGICKEMLSFSVPLIPNATMWWIINSINRPLLIDNVGLDGVGLYSVAGKFPAVISLMFTIFFNAFQISALEEYGKENFNQFYTIVFKVILILQIIITVIFEFFGDILFLLFIDEKFYSAIKYLPILCLGVSLSNIANYLGVTFTITHKTKYFFYSGVVGAMIAVIINFSIIPFLGIMGACISIILSQVGMGLYRYVKSYKYARLEQPLNLLCQISVFFIVVIFYYCIQNIVLRNIGIISCLAYLVYKNQSIIHSLQKFLKYKKV